MSNVSPGKPPPPQGPIAEAALEPRLKALLAYWRDKRAGRRLPSRGDIDPLDLRDMLGYINLVDVVQDGAAPPRFRYRLFGTEFIFYHGGDLTGQWLDAMQNGVYRTELLGLYSRIVAGAEPLMLSYDYLLDSRRHRFQGLMLPLAGDGEHVDMILSSGLPVAIY